MLTEDGARAEASHGAWVERMPEAQAESEAQAPEAKTVSMAQALAFAHAKTRTLLCKKPWGQVGFVQFVEICQLVEVCPVC